MSTGKKSSKSSKSTNTKGKRESMTKKVIVKDDKQLTRTQQQLKQESINKDHKFLVDLYKKKHPKLDWIIERRIELARRYDDQFAGLDALVTPRVPRGYRHAYQSYVTLVRDHSPMTRDELALGLQAHGISVRQGTHAVHIQGYYRSKYGLHPEDFPQALKADYQSLALPLYQTMSSEEQAWVIHHVVDLLS